MSEEIKGCNGLRLSWAPIVSEVYSAQCCQESHRNNETEKKLYEKEDIALIRLKRMAYNLERAMFIKQQRLYRLTKLTETRNSTVASLSSTSIAAPEDSKPSMHRTCRLRDGAPITPRRQLSDDLSKSSRDGKITEATQANGNCKDACAAPCKEHKTPRRRFISEDEHVAQIAEPGILSCCNPDALSYELTLQESTPELRYSFTFSKSGASAPERISKEGLSTDSSVSSAESESSSPCDLDRDVIQSFPGRKQSICKILQKVEEMGSAAQHECSNQSIKPAVQRRSSLLLNDEDASTTSLSSSSTIRMSNGKSVTAKGRSSIL